MKPSAARKPPENMPVTFGPNGTVLEHGAPAPDADLRFLPRAGTATLTGRRVRRTARAYWITTAALTFLAPLILMSLSLVDGVSAQRIWTGMGAVIPFTLIALPFSFLVNAPLVALTALPFAGLVKHTRAEHALAFVGAATAVAMALPAVFTALAAGVSAITPGEIAGAMAWFAPFGALVGALFWRVYAGAWTWRVEEPVRVADVF